MALNEFHAIVEFVRTGKRMQGKIHERYNLTITRK